MSYPLAIICTVCFLAAVWWIFGTVYDATMGPPKDDD